MVAASTVNSSVYQSGPSGRLISEVRYVLGTMCVISVLVIPLTILLLLKTYLKMYILGQSYEMSQGGLRNQGT
jgi:hypothetical protein